MNSKYGKLFEEVTFNNGVKLDTRFAMAPMVVDGSSLEGDVTEEDIKYFERRANAASLLISGAAAVTEYGNAFGYALGIYRDEQLDGLTQLATSMKSKGNKAICQIFHPGREAKVTFQQHGVVYGPSSMDVDFLDYPITGLTEEQVEEVIDQYVKAAGRAIDAGFDGVEIHGANHYLIQQFFSEISNKRNDKWGGKRENRAAFGIEITKRVKELVTKRGKKDFIIGYRISPEEIHGSIAGYTLDDSLYLIDKIADLGIDYIHSSLWGAEAYKSKALMGDHEGEIINQVIHELLAGRTKLIAAGDILSADAALDALNYTDIIALASAVLMDPEIRQKIKNGQEETINFDVTDRYDELALPKHFPIMLPAVNANGHIPQETFDYIKTVMLEEDRKYTLENKNI